MEDEVKDDLIDTRPEHMPLELVYLFDKMTSSQVSECVLWWMKTQSTRLHPEVNEQIRKHKEEQSKIDWVALGEAKERAVIDKLRNDAQDLEYFKINETLRVLREIVTKLKRINSKLRFK